MLELSAIGCPLGLEPREGLLDKLSNRRGTCGFVRLGTAPIVERSDRLRPKHGIDLDPAADCGTASLFFYTFLLTNHKKSLD
jgi:hypothetical protein